MKLFLLLLPTVFLEGILANPFKEFICSYYNICDRSPTIQECCDFLDLCFEGITPRPPTTIPTTMNPENLWVFNFNQEKNCSNAITLKDLNDIYGYISERHTTTPTQYTSSTTTTTTTQPQSTDTPEMMSSSSTTLSINVGLMLVLTVIAVGE